VALRALTKSEFKRAKKNRKKGARLRAEVLPVRDAILVGIGAKPSAPNARDRSGQTNRQKVRAVPGVTVRRLTVSRSLRAKADVFANTPFGRISFAPQGSIINALREMRARRDSAPVSPPIQSQSDVQSLYTHLGLAQAQSIGAIEATRQPIYDLIDFERQGRAVRLTKTSAAPNQAASFQFLVPADFSMQVQGIEVSTLIGPGNTTMEVLAGWNGASESVKYAKINVQAGDAPKPIFGANIEKAGGEWTREEPLDLPQGGVLTVNSGLDLNAGDILTITIQYELKPSFNQISLDPKAWIVT